MSNDTLRYSFPLVALGFATAISLFVVPRLSLQNDLQAVSFALTLDFTVVVPALVYVFILRPRELPWFGVVPTFLICVVIADAVIPDGNQTLLNSIRLLAIPAEAALVTYLILLVRKLKPQLKGDGDFITRFRSVVLRVFNTRIPSDILTTEVSVIYYLVKKHIKLSRDTKGYTVHQNVGYREVMAGLFLVLVIESVAVHILLSQWNSTVAWILTSLSIYASFWLVGDYRAMVQRPTQLTPTDLFFRVGIRWEADIKVNNIARVELLQQNSVNEGSVMDIALLGAGNLHLTFHYPVEFIGMYGFRRTVHEIRFRLDENERFYQEVNQFLSREL